MGIQEGEKILGAKRGETLCSRQSSGKIRKKTKHHLWCKVIDF